MATSHQTLRTEHQKPTAQNRLTAGHLKTSGPASAGHHYILSWPHTPPADLTLSQAGTDSTHSARGPCSALS